MQISGVLGHWGAEGIRGTSRVCGKPSTIDSKVSVSFASRRQRWSFATCETFSFFITLCSVSLPSRSARSSASGAKRDVTRRFASAYAACSAGGSTSSSSFLILCAEMPASFALTTEVPRSAALLAAASLRVDWASAWAQRVRRGEAP